MPMSSDHVTIALMPEQFTGSEGLLATYEGLTATVYRYRNGVATLRIANEAGHIALLPFQGQQIWDAEFFGRRLTMGSMFDEPVATEDYLRNYGAFFLHCGATAMGNPGPGDSHPLHGELPNARYLTAELIAGCDAEGPFMGLTGTYRHTVAFAHNYVARPTVKLHQNGGRIRLSLCVRNLKHSPMELMYLAHINFRPVDGARLIDTVPDDPAHCRVRTRVPEFFTPTEQHRKLIEALKTDPSAHRLIEPGRRIEPELVMGVDCRADDAGFAHAMQLLPDGSADYVSHRPDQLPRAVRWMTRSADQDALGLILPATAEADGYGAEKKKGNLRIVPAQGEFRCDLEFGALQREEAEALRRKIEEAVKKRR
jgi:hypothetical protein